MIYHTDIHPKIQLINEKTGVILTKQNLVSHILAYRKFLSDRKFRKIILLVREEFEALCLMLAALEEGIEVHVLLYHTKTEDLSDLKDTDGILYFNESDEHRMNITHELVDIPAVRIPPLSEYHGSYEFENHLSDAKLVYYTSGSTGVPKKIVHGRNSIISGAIRSSIFFDETDRIVVRFAINHGGVITVGIIPGLMKGATFILHKESPDLQKYKMGYFSAIEKFGCNKGLIFPHYFFNLPLDYSPKLPEGFVGISGGEVMTREFYANFKEAGGDKLYSVYGATEVLPTVCYTEVNENWFDDIRYNETISYPIGRIHPDDDVKSIDGLLYFKSRSHCLLNESEVTEQDGYVAPGDYGYVEHDQIWIENRWNTVLRNKYDEKVYSHQLEVTAQYYANRRASKGGHNSVVIYANHNGTHYLLFHNSWGLMIPNQLRREIEQRIVDKYRIEVVVEQTEFKMNGIKLLRKETIENFIQEKNLKKVQNNA